MHFHHEIFFRITTCTNERNISFDQLNCVGAKKNRLHSTWFWGKKNLPYFHLRHVYFMFWNGSAELIILHYKFWRSIKTYSYFENKECNWSVEIIFLQISSGILGLLQIIDKLDIEKRNQNLPRNWRSTRI